MKLKLFFFGCCLCACLVSGFSQSAKILVPYRIGNKWGFSDTSGKMIIAAVYDSVQQFDNWNFIRKDIALVFKKGKTAILNTAGKFIIPPVYDKLKPVYASGWSRNAIYAGNNRKTGIVNYKGTIIIPVEYDDLILYDIEYSKNANVQFLASKNKAYYQLGLNGSRIELSYANYHERSGISTGLMRMDIPDDMVRETVSIKDTLIKYGIDSISMTNFKKSPFFLIYQGTLVGLWNKKDKLILPHFEEIIDYLGDEYSSNPKIFARKEGRIGVISVEGIIVMPFKYTEYDRYNEWFIYTKQNNRMGIFSLDNGLDIIPKYDNIEPDFMRNYSLWLVTANNKKGYINNRAFEYFRN